MEITLKLNVQEVEFIAKVLGQLPTSSNAYPLMTKVIEQANEQVEDTEPVEN